MTLNERIMAVHLLQRFVRLSRTLLPLYSELVTIVEPSVPEKRRLKKIKNVYDNFKANPQASVYLVNSDIISIIQKVYYQMSTSSPFTSQSQYEYDLFITESDRLIQTWNHQQMN